MAQNRVFTVITLWFTIRIDHVIVYMTGLAKPCMSIHPMASPTFCLVSIEVSSLTVTSDCSCLVIIKRFRFYRNLLLFFEFRYYPYYYYYYSFFFRTRDCHRKSPKPHHIQPPNSTHIWTLTRHIAVRVSVLIRITVLDLEPNPCFQIFLNISEISDRIFNCNISMHRSGQELPFIFFELRALTCLWGRYDPKTENFTLFYIYLLHIHSISKTFYTLI